MTKDPLYRKILKRMCERLDPDMFERAIPDLLRPHFGLVVPVPGGSDAGFDAAVVDGEGEPFPVVCTTGKDVLRNLRRSLTSNLAAGYRRRRAIVATSQELSARRKANLSREARRLGFELVGIFDREPLASLLYDHPKVRRDLLGIGGEPRALAAVPEPGRYPVRPTLIAREEDLQWLRSMSGDRVVVGVPGSGKTALAAALVDQGKALFVRPHAPLGDILDSFRQESPAALILDDAHVELDLLRAIRIARQDAELEFDLLATTWPGQREVVAEALGIEEPTAMRTLELLTRDEIMGLYRDLDVQGRSVFMRELVDQAANRPGLAVTLATLWKRGAWEEIVRGRTLDAYARRTLRAVVGSRSGLEVLAAFSLGGSRGVPLEAVGEALGLPIAEVRQLAVSLGAAGVIDERGRDALAVQPMQLRSALLTEVYFSGRATDLDYLPLLNRVKNRTAAAEAVVYALLRGGNLPTEEARRILSSVDDPRPWAIYARLDAPEARWVLDNYPGAVVEIARAVLENAPGCALDRLLAEAYPQPESLGSTPGHPLRIIRDWVRDFSTGPRSAVVRKQLDKRRALSEAVLRHAAAGGRSEVLGPALCAVLDPSLESWEADAGSGRTLTVSADMVPAEVLERLADLWAGLRTAFPTLDRALWSSLRQLMWDLARPRIPFGKVVPEAERLAARALAARIVADLLPLARSHPGLRRQLGEFCRELGVATDDDLDPTYELLFPEEPFAVSDHAGWAAEQGRLVERLATAWANEEPTLVVGRLTHCRSEAADAGHTWPDNCPLLAEKLAARISSPQAWLEALSEAGLARALGGPFLAAVLRRREAGWQDVLLRGLESDDLAPHAVELVLIVADLPCELRQAAIQRAEDFPKLVETLAMTDRIPTPVLGDLLTCRGPMTALAAAVGHWIADPRGTVDPSVSRPWREVIIRTRERDLDGDRFDESLGYWLGEILRGDAELALHWLFAEIERSSPYRFMFRHETDVVVGAVRSLSAIQRSQVVAAAKLDDNCGAIVRSLVNDDEQVYRALLGRQDLQSLHLAPLGRCPDAGWWKLAAVALEAGRSPVDVARAAFDTLGVELIRGEESVHWSAWAEQFAAMKSASDSLLIEVAGLGEREARARVAEALRRERAEAMRGID